jgi:DNA-binding XRE family transcriptional regulator
MTRRFQKLIYNYGQAKLAQELGISRQAVFQWINGQTKPSSEMIKMLVNKFHISETEILR